MSEHEDWCLSVQPIHEDGPCNCKAPPPSPGAEIPEPAIEKCPNPDCRRPMEYEDCFEAAQRPYHFRVACPCGMSGPWSEGRTRAFLAWNVALRRRAEEAEALIAKIVHAANRDGEWIYGVALWQELAARAAREEARDADVR